jgi:hypothetical protein
MHTWMFRYPAAAGMLSSAQMLCISTRCAERTACVLMHGVCVLRPAQHVEMHGVCMYCAQHTRALMHGMCVLRSVHCALMHGMCVLRSAHRVLMHSACVLCSAQATSAPSSHVTCHSLSGHE